MALPREASASEAFIENRSHRYIMLHDQTWQVNSGSQQWHQMHIIDVDVCAKQSGEQNMIINQLTLEHSPWVDQ